MWRVRWRDAGRVHRRFFPGRDGADTHAAMLKDDLVTARKRIAALPQDDIEQLLAIHSEAKTRGLGLSGLITLLNDSGEDAASKDAKAALDEMINAKRNAGRAEDYLYSLSQIVGAFIKGRESIAVSKLGFADVESHLKMFSIRSRSTLRSRLSTFFKFCERRGYTKGNPCDRLEVITAQPKTVSIMKIKEVETCLAWFKSNPRAFAWFALSTFAGLRPEEAQKTRWKDINFKEGWIKVEWQTTKVRQRRVVYPEPMAMKYLKQAKRLRSQLPISTKIRTVEQKKLRAKLGWPKWKQDVTRHTCASMWLAYSGSSEKVALSLGHSEAVLKRDYMALVTKADAEKFYAS
jgi:integrase